MKAKHLLHISLFLSIGLHLTDGKAQTLSILNEETGEPVPYCNVQIIGDGFGTVSDASGKLALPDSVAERMDKEDSLHISVVGYQDRTLGRKTLHQKLKNEGTVQLSPKSIEKDPVTVKGYEKTEVRIGRKTHNRMTQKGFGVTKEGSGFETGSVIKVRRPFTELDTFGFYITKSSSPKEHDTALIRLNLYHLDEQGATFNERVDSLINDSLIKFEVPMEKGGLTIDISKQHITVHKDFLASIEVLEKSYEGVGWLHFSARTFGGKTYNKGGVGKPWKEGSMGSFAFYFKGRMPTWIESMKLKDEVPE